MIIHDTVVQSISFSFVQFRKSDAWYDLYSPMFLQFNFSLAYVSNRRKPSVTWKKRKNDSILI